MKNFIFYSIIFCMTSCVSYVDIAKFNYKYVMNQKILFNIRFIEYVDIAYSEFINNIPEKYIIDKITDRYLYDYVVIKEGDQIIVSLSPRFVLAYHWKMKGITILDDVEYTLVNFEIIDKVYTYGQFTYDFSEFEESLDSNYKPNMLD